MERRRISYMVFEVKIVKVINLARYVKRCLWSFHLCNIQGNAKENK